MRSPALRLRDGGQDRDGYTLERADTITSCRSLAAVALVAAGLAGLLVARHPVADPQHLVDDEAVALQSLHGAGDVARPVVDTGHVARVVVDEPAGHLLAEVRVGLRVEDERVPADVHELRRAVATLGLTRAERQEGQGLVHDALREGELHGLVLDDPGDEARPELLVDEVLVGQLAAGRRLTDVGVHGHAVFLPLDKTGHLSGYII